MSKFEDRLISEVDGVGDRCFRNLHDNGYTTIGDVLRAQPDDVTAVKGFDMNKYSKVLRYALDELEKTDRTALQVMLGR